MSSPTSASKPSSSLAHKQSRPKLRASCDACAASKVKCSKEHPICTRCATNGSQCIYGVSRKHGKPGRSKKRKPDPSPFSTISKPSLSPDGCEFGKFRVQPEPTLQLVPEPKTTLTWPPIWSGSLMWSGTPEVILERNSKPAFYTPATTDFHFNPDGCCISNIETELIHPCEPELAYQDFHAKKPSLPIDLPNLQDSEHFIGGHTVNPSDYTFHNTADPDTIPLFPAKLSPQSLRVKSGSDCDSTYGSASTSTSHSCFPFAYSILESLNVTGADGSPQQSPMIPRSFDSIILLTRLAVQNVLLLLSCSCSSDPHLAMLYSSIASKILTCYQTIAGVVTVDSSSTPLDSPFSSNGYPSSSLSPTSSVSSSPLTSPCTEESMAIKIQAQPRYNESCDNDENKFARQLVLHELKSYRQLVEAIANWNGNRQSEQAEYLYDFLGAWLKSELYKTMREMESIDTS